MFYDVCFHLMNKDLGFLSNEMFLLIFERDPSNRLSICQKHECFAETEYLVSHKNNQVIASSRFSSEIKENLCQKPREIDQRASYELGV